MASTPEKLSGYDFYRKVLGSPKLVVAPMVEQSELAWRVLSRRYGAQIFADEKHIGNREGNFSIIHKEEGGPLDRPLIVQFCGNDPEALLISAKLVEPYCDAVDINFGCPQDIARRGGYGCFLQDDWDLVYKLINTLHVNLSIPVTAKFRVFPSLERTVEYAKMMERAGAQILTCHGRTREQRGHKTGLADWDKIRAVKDAVSVPVFANGNILYGTDVERCLAATGADAVMSAEGQLYNAALFSSTHPHPPHAELASEYLDIVRQLKTPTSGGAIKAHLFKLMRPGLHREIDLRNRLGLATNRSGLGEFQAIVDEMRERMERDSSAARDFSESQIEVDADGNRSIPHWLAQPYFRPITATT